MNRKIIYSIYAMLVLNLPAFAQNDSDSLQYQKVLELNKKCKEAFRANETDKALDAGLAAIQLSENINVSSDEIIDSYNLVGLIYKNQKKDYDKAISYFNKALLIQQMSNNHKATATILTNMGSTYEDLGNYKIGLDYRLKCLEKTKLFEADANFLQYTYHAIMEDYEKLGNKVEAKKYEKLYKQVSEE